MHSTNAFGRVLALCLFLVFTFVSPTVNAHRGVDNGHGPNNRSAWIDGFDIYSDYTNNSVIPPGKLVEYEFTLSQQWVSPDGFPKFAQVVNGQYPGPTLEANWGDTIRVTVHNNFTEDYNGTSLHWHGIRQYQTNWLDGVPGVTQCPSKPLDTQVYEFRAMQYGTSWYHGHFSLQYSNGLYGPIVIHGPSSANWDEDLGPWILSDWYHADVFGLEWIGETTFLAALPDSFVLNGKGKFQDQGELYEVAVSKNKTYKIGIINTSTLLTYTFWIDGHNLTIIQTDFVPIEPYTVSVINVGIGQRYEFIIETNADLVNGTNFWVNAQYCAEPELIPISNKVGVIRYDAADTSDPYTPEDQHVHFGCADPEPKNLVPVVKQNVGTRVNGIGPEDYLKLGHQAYPNATDFPGTVRKWVIQQTPQFVSWTEPSLWQYATKDNVSLPAEAVPFILDYDDDEWVYFVITSNYTLLPTDLPRNLTPSVHPMHLHGHDLSILAQGEGEIPDEPVLNFENPARRDVIDIDVGGWAVIAFQINNPGAWLFHCHIAFHSSAGLSLQFIEQPSKIKPLLERSGVLPEFDDRCKLWAEWYNTVSIPHNATMDDSGI